MAMSAGGRRGRVAAEINVTPMIDVLLVLLVVFMVMQQGLRRGVSVQVPPPSAGRDAAPAPIVLEVDEGALEETLRGIFSQRPRKVLFVQGSEGLTCAEVLAAVDAGRAAGVAVVGLVPRRGAS